MPAFICPRCANRERGDRLVNGQPRGCSRCGFGFLFELLEDYYAGPKTALIVCDQERRIIAGGHASTAITGYQERDLLGREVIERLGMSGFPNGDPAQTALEWGVRQLEVPCTFRPNGIAEDRPAHADFFPAYDADGGLLVALTPD
jgi:hypothetical protein